MSPHNVERIIGACLLLSSLTYFAGHALAVRLRRARRSFAGPSCPCRACADVYSPVRYARGDA